MATNKNAQLRYQVLDKCFRNPGRRYFIGDLLEECNRALYELNGPDSQVKKRQLYDDIRFMESDAGWSIPLERHREGKRIWFRYEDLEYSINNQPLNEADIHQLQSAIQVLSKLQGIPQLDVVQEVLGKLKIGSTLESLQPAVSFDENQFLKGRAFFPQLFNAITYQTVLQVAYQDFRVDEPYELLFHPHHLKQYNNRWFVFGYNQSRDRHCQNLALDRIVSIQTMEAETYIPSNINWQEYFDDFIGVTKTVGEEPVKIQLWFDPGTAPYVTTKPIHGSQRKIRQDEEGLIIELNLIPNYEFYRMVREFGDKVKVLAPDDQVKKMEEMLAKAAALYQRLE